jgi:truncated hemoglobin YjbI
MIAVMNTQAQSLYTRVGGEAGVAQLVDAFYGRVLADPELKGFFERTSIEKLTAMQRDFLPWHWVGPSSIQANRWQRRTTGGVSANSTCRDFSITS